MRDFATAATPLKCSELGLLVACPWRLVGKRLPLQEQAIEAAAKPAEAVPMLSLAPFEAKKHGAWEPLKQLAARRWRCRCDCGRVRDISETKMLSGLGCFVCKRNVLKHLPRWLQKHLYAKAHDAISRCTNRAVPQYEDYGGRGICIHEAWLSDRRAFALYLSTLPGHSDKSLVLDRIDNDGNYEPGNLRFVPPRRSLLNRRKEKR